MFLFCSVLFSSEYKQFHSIAYYKYLFWPGYIIKHWFLMTIILYLSVYSVKDHVKWLLSYRIPWMALDGLHHWSIALSLPLRSLQEELIVRVLFCYLLPWQIYTNKVSISDTQVIYYTVGYFNWLCSLQLRVKKNKSTCTLFSQDVPYKDRRGRNVVPVYT